MSEREAELINLLREACGLLTSYADVFTWDEELNAARDELFARIAKVVPDHE